VSVLRARILLWWWPALATSLIAAAIADPLTEFVSNAGFLGAGAFRDGSQQSVIPVAILAAVVLICLGLSVALCAGKLEMRLACAPRSALGRLLFAAGSLSATFAIIVLMEGYETHFGGIDPFSPGSVLVSHAPAVLAAYAIVAALVSRLVSYCLRAAHAAGTLAGGVLSRFLRIDARNADALSSHISALGVRVVVRTLVLVRGHLHLRAPPVAQSIPIRLLT
jgi:hypothetical protein